MNRMRCGIPDGSIHGLWHRSDGLSRFPDFQRPECIGATIHLASEKVESNEILGHVRPENIVSQDKAHDIGTKSIISGLRLMLDIVPAYINGRIEPIPHDLSIENMIG